MANQINRTIIAMILIILWPILVHSATLYSDNFDSCTSGCEQGTTKPNSSTMWSDWTGKSEPPTETIDGVTHYAGEITSPGRGGTGKSLKIWRNGVFSQGYIGTLLASHDATPPQWPTKMDHFFMRYYIKMPVALDVLGGGTYIKLWRLLTDSSDSGYNEIYLNVNATSGNSSMRDYGVLQLYDGSGWTGLLSNAELKNIWDGNWHCLEFEIGITANILRLYVDGTLKYEDTSRTWHLHGTVDSMNHFALGNNSGAQNPSHQWQTGWQAMELDDLVFSTTYVGPASGGADTTPLTKKPQPPVIMQLQ